MTPQFLQADSSPVDRLSDLTEKSFRVRESLQVSLDGTPQSSDIERFSQTSSEVVFVNSKNWRVRRELPFSHTLNEYLRRDAGFFEATPSNRLVIAKEEVQDTVWAEVALTPLRLAEEWGLVDGGISWSSWLSLLKKSTSPLKNNANQIDYTLNEDGSIHLSAKGTILQDGKTLMNVEVQWDLQDVGLVQETKLNDSLMRTF